MLQMLKKGFFAIAPLAISLAIFIWLFDFLESTFKTPVIWIVGNKYYYPGMGLAFALILLFLVGTVVNTFLAKKLTEWGERIIKKIPLVKTIYTAIQDFMEYFNAPKQRDGSKIVVATIQGMEVMGIVTKSDLSDFPELQKNKQIAVYFPMSYQIGGYTVLLSEDQVRYIDMSVETALQFILTAGAKQKKE
jgi:uncharacterized membrane protein